jgi:hypothetical protein
VPDDDLDPRALAAAMSDAIGPALTAAACGVDRAVTVAAWADGAAAPAVTEVARLRVLARAWGMAAGAEGITAAKAWLVEGNPALDGDSPLTALREGRDEEVLSAARALVEDTPPS